MANTSQQNNTSWLQGILGGNAPSVETKIIFDTKSSRQFVIDIGIMVAILIAFAFILNKYGGGGGGGA